MTGHPRLRDCAVWLVGLWLAMTASLAWAGPQGFHFSRIGSERGLAQNSITALTQDADGFMWVGTQGGLHRYDGQRYSVLRHDPRNPASLPDSYVTALALKGRGALWVGTYSEYVARLDLGTGTIRRYASPPSRAARHVQALLADGPFLWIGTLAGLERLDTRNGQRLQVLRLAEAPLRASPGQHLLAQPGGGVLYGAGTGLYRVSGSGKVEAVGAPGPVRALLGEADGAVWVGRSDGLHRVQRDVLVRIWPAAGTQRAVRAIARTRDGALWISIFNEGLARLGPAGDMTPIRERVAGTTGLTEDTINVLRVDHSGLLWVGGQFRGVAVVDPRGTRFEYLLDPRSAKLAVQDSARAVFPHPDGSLWIGTDSGQLLRHDLSTGLFQDFSPLLTALPEGPGLRRVMAMARAEQGRIWVATLAGLYRLDPIARRLEPVPLGAFSDAQLRSMRRGRNGVLWLGTSADGLLRRDATGRVTHVRSRQVIETGQAQPMIHALHEDVRGRVWIGTGDGLDLYDPSRGTVRNFRHVASQPASLGGNLVRALHADRDGTLWVGTHSGLSRVVERVPGQIGFAHPLADALGDQPVPVVFAIQQSRPDELWLATDAGIIRFEPDTVRARAFDLADGLQDMEFNGGAGARLADGRLAFGGVRGVNLFDPARIIDSTFFPPVRLLAAQVGTQAPGYNEVLWQSRQVDLPGDADLLRLRIGALDFAPGGRLRYRYRLDGFDRAWIDNGPYPDITYTRLPPGRYTFEAQASNRDGIWGDQTLRVPLHVAPPLWRHPIALAVAALALAAAISLLVLLWYRRRQRELGYFRQIEEREERLKLALWASGEQFWDYDLTSQQLHRMRIDEAPGPASDFHVASRVADEHFIHPDDLPAVLNSLRAHLRGESPLFMCEHRLRYSDDNDAWIWVRARGRVVERDANGRALRVAGTARDITAIRHAERERRVSSEVLRSMAEAVAVFDRDFCFVAVNPAFCTMTGYSESDVAGCPTALLDGRKHDERFYVGLRETLRLTGSWSGEVWQQRKDGSEFLCWLQASAVEDTHGEPSFYVAVVSDITDQKRAEQELRYLANYDTLTRLPNRTLLSDRLSMAMTRAQREHSKVAVLFLDLDRFKDINDTLGHAAGDRLLQAVAQRLQQVVGVQHTVARLGGDEFTVVIEHLQDIESAEKIAQAIIDAFDAPLEFPERPDVVVSPSIGISIFPDHAHTASDLIKHADTAMYKAKAAGRRTFMRYHEAMDIEVRRRATISAALRKVLDRNEFKLVFQPQLSLRDNRITGVEALLRWNSAEHGQIPPMQFIPLAEENGLILDIGEWVLRAACEVLRDWRLQGLTDITMAVNVSALQLLRGDLPTVVACILGDTGVPPERLELELTESMLMANAEQTASTLQAFRALGVGMAIDDFGTGYSSLSYLKRLPITTLKIDKAFIDDVTHDAEDEAITTTIIAMAHSLGINVVAEGVETPAQAAFLRDHACDEIQGYWLSHPLDADDCLVFIRDWMATRVDGGVIAG